MKLEFLFVDPSRLGNPIKSLNICIRLARTLDESIAQLDHIAGAATVRIDICPPDQSPFPTDELLGKPYFALKASLYDISNQPCVIHSIAPEHECWAMIYAGFGDSGTLHLDFDAHTNCVNYIESPMENIVPTFLDLLLQTLLTKPS